MKSFRVMLGDWFEDFEAETEADAIEQMRQKVLSELLEDGSRLIAWETPATPSPPASGSSLEQK